MDAYTPPQQDNEELVEDGYEADAQSDEGIDTYASTKAPSIYFNTGDAIYPKIYVNTTNLKNLCFKIS